MYMINSKSTNSWSKAKLLESWAFVNAKAKLLVNLSFYFKKALTKILISLCFLAMWRERTCECFLLLACGRLYCILELPVCAIFAYGATCVPALPFCHTTRLLLALPYSHGFCLLLPICHPSSGYCVCTLCFGHHNHTSSYFTACQEDSYACFLWPLVVHGCCCYTFVTNAYNQRC